MYKTTLITTILLLLVSFGLSGCSQSTARAHDAQIGEHGCSNEVALGNSSLDSGIDIDWPY